MESTDNYRAIAESTTDWESGNTEMPVARTDYVRASHNHALYEGPEGEANSDLGNLGRDVEAEPAEPARNH